MGVMKWKEELPGGISAAGNGAGAEKTVDE